MSRLSHPESGTKEPDGGGASQGTDRRPGAPEETDEQQHLHCPSRVLRFGGDDREVGAGKEAPGKSVVLSPLAGGDCSWTPGSGVPVDLRRAPRGAVECRGVYINGHWLRADSPSPAGHTGAQPAPILRAALMSSVAALSRSQWGRGLAASAEALVLTPRPTASEGSLALSATHGRELDPTWWDGEGHLAQWALVRRAGLLALRSGT